MNDSPTAAVCDTCGAEFPRVRAGMTECVCGGQLIIFGDDGSVLETMTSAQRQGIAALLPDNAAMTAHEALATVIKVVSHEAVPIATARRAVGIVLGDYEEGLLVTLVGAARARTNRLMKLMGGLSLVEDKLLTPEVIGNMEPSGLLKLYRTMQVSFVNDTEMLERVIELRTRIEAMQAHGLPLAKTADTDPLDDEMTRSLPPAKRERLRRTLTTILNAVKTQGETQ